MRERPLKRSSQVASKELPRKYRLPNINSLFLIDGQSPVQPYPQLIDKTRQLLTTNGPGRQRSVDIKGLLLALIDEIYPPLICPECYQTSSGRSEADEHFRELHRGRKVFQCVSSTCEQAYSTKAGLRYHLEHAHQVTIPTIIPPLPSIAHQKRSRKTAASVQKTLEKSNRKLKMDQLSDQLQKTLDNIYPMTVCPICKQLFTKKTHVITHLVDSHHKEEPYQCIVVGCEHAKRYATREGLLYHLVTCHKER